jgi:RIO kinase 1
MYTDTDRFHDIARDFLEAGYIAGEGRIIKRGKEASVLRCPAHPSLGVAEVALKVYKDEEFRNFRNDAAYLRGRVWKRRDLAHLKAFKDDLWVDTEYRVLDELREARVRVPRPYTQIGHAIIMDFVGVDGEAAVPLKDVRLSGDEAPRVFDEIVTAIDGMLRCGIIHGDLSAFNILYDGEHPVIIDFPQAVRVSTHDEPYELFRRDVQNVVSYFDRYGVTDPERLTDELWGRYYLPVGAG